MKKPKFSEAAKPPSLTIDQNAFIEGGRGKDKNNIIPNNPSEATHRLSFDVPKRLASRFKAACALADTKMTTEFLTFIERRTKELEERGTQ